MCAHVHLSNKAQHARLTDIQVSVILGLSKMSFCNNKYSFSKLYMTNICTSNQAFCCYKYSYVYSVLISQHSNSEYSAKCILHYSLTVWRIVLTKYYSYYYLANRKTCSIQKTQTTIHKHQKPEKTKRKRKRS